MQRRFTDEELDVLLYVTSYIAAYSADPTRQELFDKGLESQVVKDLVTQGFLAQIGDRVQLVEASITAHVQTHVSGLQRSMTGVPSHRQHYSDIRPF